MINMVHRIHTVADLTPDPETFEPLFVNLCAAAYENRITMNNLQTTISTIFKMNGNSPFEADGIASRIVEPLYERMNLNSRCEKC